MSSNFRYTKSDERVKHYAGESASKLRVLFEEDCS